MKKLVVLSLLISTAAFGAEKVDFTTVLLDQDNSPMQECADIPAPRADSDCKVRHSVTLGMVAMRALAVPEQNLAPEESLKRGQLALNVYRSTGASLTAEETALIKKQIAKSYSPLVVARAFPILDPGVKDAK